MNYEQAYKTLNDFVNNNNFEGVEEVRGLFDSMNNELIKSGLMEIDGKQKLETTLNSKFIEEINARNAAENEKKNSVNKLNEWRITS
ncbi:MULTISPECIES: hypothetical protein [Enterococcus]|uniref:Uncharacterized protein n=1 Tax=Candidatus Enterococcus mangumiae TaxID=2230878 RepID=A0ABZ2SWE6_9ENTE|nr:MULTISPECIES: hypothetical protein [unclassified Enterococcus]MBO0489082.1 hypothetical protein [Enterococcus sp. DIV1094]MBO1298485.1 hypothetical protein [Enterococcus sp. DIV1271a]